MWKLISPAGKEYQLSIATMRMLLTTGCRDLQRLKSKEGTNFPKVFQTTLDILGIIITEEHLG